jgi:peptide/nickel transport system substrate-binding protein
MNEYEQHLVEEVRAGGMTRAELLRRASVLGLAAIPLSGLLAACGNSGGSAATQATGSGTANEGKPQYGGTATIALPPPTASVDPVQMDNIGANLTVPIAAQYLVYPDPKYVLKPVLATKWEALNTSKPDVWEFKIRQGVKWHDGSPLTVDDVVASIARLANPKSASPALTNFEGVLTDKGVEKVDAETVRFNLEVPSADFPYALSAFNYNTVILPKNYQIGEFEKGGIGTGPYILQKVQPGVRAQFTKNPHYWQKGQPYLDGIVAQYFPDTASAVLAIQSGEVDLYANTPYQGSQALFADPDIVVFENESSEYREVQMRVDQTPFKDKRVRQAVAYSLDRKALVEGLFQGKATVGNDHGFAPIFPASAQALKDIPQREQDYEKAKALLTEAGYPEGIDVTLTAENFLEAAPYGVTIAQQAKGANIRVNLKTVSQTQYYGSEGSGQPWLTVPFGVTGWGERGTPVQLITPAYTSDGIWNSAHWKNDKFTKLIAQLGETVDVQSQQKIASEAAAIQNDETPAVIGYWVNQLRSKRNNLHGIASGPASHLEVAGMWKS